MPRGRLLIVVAFIIVLAGVVIAIVLGGGLGGGGTPATDVTPGTTDNTGGNQAVDQLPTATPIEFVEIVIAVQRMPRGFRITPNAVELRRWPLEAAPFNSIRSLEDVVGKIARTDIFVEQPILVDMVVEDLSQLANVGSDLAAVLPSGQVAISVPIDRITSVAYGIQPGDRVNIILSMLFVDVDEVFQSLAPNCYTLFFQTAESVQFTDSICGRITVASGFNTLAILNASESQRPRLVTQQTVQNAQVMYLGDFPADGRFLGVPLTPTPAPEEQTTDATSAEDPATRREATAAPTANLRPDIITLAVTPQDAVILSWAVEARMPITFALRSAQDLGTVPTDAVNLDTIMSQFNITVPTARNYTIEPAVRSIRQLFVGNQISLGNNIPATSVPSQ
ncbi:MAG: Flp pilus assembly protein CpaB [Anaerolineae bacterium]